MYKKYGIGFLIGIMGIILLYILVYRTSYHHALEQKEAQRQTRQETETCYYIKAKDGYVTVYQADQKTVYEYTSIVVEELPDELQNGLKDGIKVLTLGQVYGFLENYSS